MNSDRSSSEGHAATLVEPAAEALAPNLAQDVESHGIKSKEVSADAAKDQPNQPAAPAPPAGFDIPDGGWQAWKTVIAAWLFLFCTFGYVNAFGVYQEYYTLYFLPDKSSSDIAWIGSFQLFLQFFLGAVSGKLFDEGYFRYLLIGGSFLYVLGLMMVSLATQYYSIFLAQGLTVGLGIGFIFVPAIGAISHHFKRRRALATGIAVSGSSVGGIIFPIMLNNLFKSVGFGWAVRATAFLNLGCLVIANILITTRLPPFKKRPAHMQVRPDMKAIFRDVPYWICAFGLFFVVLGLFFPIIFVQIFATSQGLDNNIAFYTLAVLNAGSIFGRVLPNFMADIYGPLNLILPCVVVCGGLQWVMLACNNPGGIMAFSAIYGFFSGAYVSLLASVQVGFANSPFEIGIRVGLPFVLIAVGGLVGSPIIGELVGSGPTFYWWKGATFAGVTCLFGAFLIFTARAMHAKRRGTQKL